MTQFILDLLISVLCVSIVAQYSWSSKYHFQAEGFSTEVKFLMAAVAVTALTFMYFVWKREQPAVVSIVALAMILTSDLLFWWSVKSSRKASLGYIFNKDERRPVIKNDIYAYIRHPFYASYILFWTGWAVAVWHPLAALPVLLFITVFYKAARAEEAAFDQSKFRDDYAQYKREAGLFWPKVFR